MLGWVVPLVGYPKICSDTDPFEFDRKFWFCVRGIFDTETSRQNYSQFVQSATLTENFQRQCIILKPEEIKFEKLIYLGYSVS